MSHKYDEVLHIIENTRRFGNYTGFEVSRHILEKLGHPECGMPFVHVAGTNGKGSTTAFLCEMLQQTGKKVGMFTSPHLVNFEERIRINGQMISKEDVTRLGNQLLSMQFEISPTMFDYCLAMAVLYFKEQHCDIIVMETGIGGLYDSTNALGVPEASIITKIGMDHTAILGDTLKEIALQKAGIIKKGALLVHQIQEPEVVEVLKRTYLEKNETTDGYYAITPEDIQRLNNVELSLLGEFQKENAMTAIYAFYLLLEHSFVFEHQSYDADEKEQMVRKALTTTVWKGRMEVLCKEPFFLVDGAHNGHGVHALAEGLKGLYPNEKFHFIMGVMADKDYETMIEELLPLAIDFTTVTPESSRALQAKELAECITKKGIEAHHAPSVQEVIAPFCNGTAIDDKHKTIAFGSLYFIGEIEAMFQHKSC